MGPLHINILNINILLLQLIKASFNQKLIPNVFGKILYESFSLGLSQYFLLTAVKTPAMIASDGHTNRCAM